MAGCLGLMRLEYEVYDALIRMETDEEGGI